MIRKMMVLMAALFLLSPAVTLAEMCKADIDCNTKVDLADLVIMKQEFLNTGCSPCCNICQPYPPIAASIPMTGQTECYDESGSPIDCAGTGQDGDLQKGVAWPVPRFTNPNGTVPVDGDVVLDNLTGLVWTKNANLVGKPTWQGALNYIASMNDGTNENFEYVDWRLPNIKELKSLIDFANDNPALPSGHPFVNVQTDSYYWSSTTYIYDPNNAWCIGMVHPGFTSPDYPKSSNNTVCVWPVRGETKEPASIPKTGQSTSYVTRDDGDLEKGIAWPKPRFTDNNDGTVRDNLTGLIWLKNADCFGLKTWSQSISDCNGLANGQCGLTDGSMAGDWRLPNYNELYSIIDYEKDSPIMPAASPFVNVMLDYYFSSTSYTTHPQDAQCVHMGHGWTAPCDEKTISRYFWPVRDVH